MSYAQAKAAIEASDAAALAALLDADPALADAHEAHCSLLHHAACQANPACLDLLLAAGAQPDGGPETESTPLIWAATMARLDACQRLVAAGADVEADDGHEGGTALVQALFYGCRDCADYLATLSRAPDNLRVAAGLGDLQRLAELVRPDGTLAPEAGRGRTWYRPHDEFPPWTPSERPQEILDEALFYAAANGRVAAVRWLLDRGAQLEGRPYWATPVHIAQWAPHHEVLGALLEREPRLDVKDLMYGGTALSWTEYVGDDASRRMLRDYAAAQGIADATKPSEPDLLAQAAAEDANATIACSVPRSGSEVLEVEVPVLLLAAVNRRRELCEDLLARGASLNAWSAAALGHIDFLQSLDATTLDTPDEIGRTPLHRAIQGHATETVRWLLDHGADPQAPADTFTFGPQALHVAAEADAPAELIDVLVAHGAPINKNCNPGTPLDVALRHDKPAAAAALRAHGALTAEEVEARARGAS